MINDLIAGISATILGLPHYFDIRTAKGRAVPITTPVITCTGVRGSGRRLTTFISVIIKESSNKVLHDLIEDILSALLGYHQLTFTECVITSGTDGSYAELSFTHIGVLSSDILDTGIPVESLTQTFNQNCP